jgi:REP element-mobilizing transposase RayT
MFDHSCRRKPVRLAYHDYSSVGPYFVTISTHNQRRILSSISSTEVILTNAGETVREIWLSMPGRFPGLVLDEFVIMPNHFHALLAFATPRALAARRISVGEGLAPPSPVVPANRKPICGVACSLPSVIGAFKSLSTIRVNKLLNTPSKPLWQRTYHDHIIRTADDMKNAQRYIQENPLRWSLAEPKASL